MKGEFIFSQKLAMRIFVQLLSLLLVIFINCCKPPERHLTLATNIKNKGVFIVNEGGFNFGNASISYFDNENDSLAEDLFKANNNISLGDVAQSMGYFEGKYYVVVNNSGKIEKLDTRFKSEGQIRFLTSPRYFLPITNEKAYISDLYANEIHVVDLINLQKKGSIRCPGWTEKMLKIDSLVYVTNVYREYLYIVNSNRDILVDSIKIAYGAGSLVLDKNNKIWVALIGDSDKGVVAQIQRIDPKTKKVEMSWNKTTAQFFAQKLGINDSADTLYWLDQGLMKASIDETTYPQSPFIKQANANFYSLGIADKIYIGDALDYVQKGKVLIYNFQGKLEKTLRVGINPGEFYFKK